jgi:hypothetical protein
MADSTSNERASKLKRKTALDLAEQHIRDSKIAPGFDYAKTVLELEARFADLEIALACGEVSATTVENW